jgi:hypothetical protein
MDPTLAKTKAQVTQMRKLLLLCYGLSVPADSAISLRQPTCSLWLYLV